MTVIVTDGLYMAADTKVVDDDRKTYCPKLFVVENKQTIIGVAGDYAKALKFVEWYGNRRLSKKPFTSKKAEWEALVWSKKHGVQYWNRDLEPMSLQHMPYAIGSGSFCALAAIFTAQTVDELYCNNTAECLELAVRAAIEVDDGCGGNTQIVKLTWPTKIAGDL